MVRRVTLVEFSDLLFCAESIGISWNTAHDILVRDGIPPEAECNQRDYYKSDLEGNGYGWSADTVKILTAFFEKEKLSHFTLVND